jgi:hypothetical protein
MADYFPGVFSVSIISGRGTRGRGCEPSMHEYSAEFNSHLEMIKLLYVVGNEMVCKVNILDQPHTIATRFSAAKRGVRE